MIRRREFITGLGGAAAWPMVARAQQRERVRKVGVLLSFAGDDPEVPPRLAALRRELERLGWSEGRELGLARAGMFMVFPQGRLLSFYYRSGCRSRSAGRSGAAGVIGTLAHLASQPFFAVPAFAESPLRCCETSGKTNSRNVGCADDGIGRIAPMRGR